MKERLQKIMAKAGIGSRRHNETLIRDGRVRVNGRVTTLGDKADPASDQIEVDGKRLDLSDRELVYIALNKPKGVISSLEDELQQNRRTVRDLVELPGHLYPVGRLDKQSEGLMLMTNDGKLAHRLTHPRYGHEKVYQVVVEGHIPMEAIAQWRQGVMLDGRKTAPAQVEISRRSKTGTHLKVVLQEGRKRQIRRVAAMLGHPVQRLERRQIGPLSLGDLKSGQWRHLTGREVKALRRAAGLKAPPRSRKRRASRRKGKSRSS